MEETVDSLQIGNDSLIRQLAKEPWESNKMIGTLSESLSKERMEYDSHTQEPATVYHGLEEYPAQAGNLRINTSFTPASEAVSRGIKNGGDTVKRNNIEEDMLSNLLYTVLYRCMPMFSDLCMNPLNPEYPILVSFYFLSILTCVMIV